MHRLKLILKTIMTIFLIENSGSAVDLRMIAVNSPIYNNLTRNGCLFFTRDNNKKHNIVSSIKNSPSTAAGSGLIWCVKALPRVSPIDKYIYSLCIDKMWCNVVGNKINDKRNFYFFLLVTSHLAQKLLTSLKSARRRGDTAICLTSAQILLCRDFDGTPAPSR